MIHAIQCLCGPKRHCIYGIMYDDTRMTPQDAMDGIRALTAARGWRGTRRCEPIGR